MYEISGRFVFMFGYHGPVFFFFPRDQSTTVSNHNAHTYKPYIPGQIVARAEGQDGDAGRGVPPGHRVHHLKDTRGRAVPATDLICIYMYVCIYYYFIYIYIGKEGGWGVLYFCVYIYFYVCIKGKRGVGVFLYVCAGGEMDD